MDSGACGAARNMAVDEAVLAEHAAGRTEPTLRFYQWDPPALSIGRFQSLEDVNLAALRREGFALVRRPTGGRAVLHRADLTYCVVAGQSVLSGSVLETYRQLSGGLLAGLRLLGVPAELAGEEASGDTHQAACFAVPSSYELLAGGRKLVGSAQVRQKSTILQHGSLLLDFDPFLLARLTVPAGRAAQAAALYRERVTSLKEILGRVPPYGELVRAMARGFARALGVVLVPGALTAREEDLAHALAVRYADGGPS